MFEQANALRKTQYQKATQLPRVGSNSIFIAVNPSQRPPQNQQSSLTSPSLPKMSSMSGTASASSPAANSEQVSILVRPQKGGKPVLLNVPRRVAMKVKNGTTLSFSASNDRKYVVISNKIHPPVKPDSQKPPKVAPQPSASVQQLQRSNFPTKNSNPVTKSGGLSGLLPSSVSLEPVSKSSLSVNRRRPAVSVSINRAPEPPSKTRKSGVLSSGEM